ncbi:D-glycero-beta-D-manno-heptose-7-phosphate kinase [Celeribacter sp.]|uniref:D-glycero-beta-D-manno-heptose-7-phosphate kinase n=1 Tax=Celeribacter sp. TaxID=1890673 RepID=UPI003A933CD8
MTRNYKMLEGAVARLSGGRVLCLGDVMLDTFNTGHVSRISPESPVPVFGVGPQTSLPGGAANVARNVAALGGECILVGAIGADAAGRELTHLLGEAPAITADLVTDATRRTTQKTRFIAQGQHILRVDSESEGPIGEGVEAALVAAAIRALDTCHVVVLSDYAKGVLSDRVIAEVTAAARARGIAVFADPKSTDFKRYAGATLLTPNLKEARAAFGAAVAGDAQIEAAGRTLLARAGVEALLITRSEEGMTLIEAGDAPCSHLAAQTQEVFDVVGAGDTVIATLALGFAAGLSLPLAAEMANVAAGIVVGKRDTATVAPEELIERLATLAAGGRRLGAPVLLSAHEAGRYAAARRAEGKRIGFTNGVFDIVHPGHISLLEFARKEVDCLIVGLNSDASVRRLGKGPDRPVNSENDRATVLGAFGSVEAVVIFDDDTPVELIKSIRPDMLVKGADYTIETVVGADIVAEYGGEVRLAPIVSGKSSTNIIERVSKYGEKA